MTYVLTDGASAVLSYPYSVGLLRRDNPRVSFPANPTLEQLAEWNVFTVANTAQPMYDVITESVSEGVPELSNGSWRVVWVVAQATQEEIQQRIEQYQQSAASTSEGLLAASDSYIIRAISDGVNLHPDFIQYRAALGNVSALPGYPVAPVWPTLPQNIFDGNIDLVGELDALLGATE